MKGIHVKDIIDICPSCDAHICPCVIDQIRMMENAMVVAKQAVETLDALNNKLTKRIEVLKDKVAELEEKNKRITRDDIKVKMGRISKQHQRLENRGRLIH